jgi:hypothetical protein
MRKSAVGIFVVQLSFACALAAPHAFAKPVSSGALGVCAVDGGHIWFTQTKKWCCTTYPSGHPDQGKRYCVTCVHDQAGNETCDEALVTPSRPVTPPGTRK